MKSHAFALAFVLGLAVAPVQLVSVQQTRAKGGEEETGPYDVVPNWPKPLPSHNAEWTFGGVVGVFAETPDRVFVLTRGDQPPNGDTRTAPPRRQNFLFVVNRNGEMIENWSQ